MYLPRAPKKEEKEHPMQVKNSESFMRTALVTGTLTCIVAAIMALRKVQTRQRQPGQELVRKRGGQRVVIIGAGAGGCAAAAMLANALPDVRITVIEKDRYQVFQGHVPLAHVGHRSYDLGTTTGFDVLRSPATWNVTRDANLVAAEVLRVDPEMKRVYVRSSPGMLASAKPLGEAQDEARTSTVMNPLLRWWRSVPEAPTTLSINDDGSPNLSDGTTVFSYDALIVAAGAQRTMGNLRGQLQPHQIDSYRIAVNPGTTRDSLATIFAGNVVHVKVPPASFVCQMEAARALLQPRKAKRQDGCVLLDLGKQSPTPTAAAGAASPTDTTTTVVPTSVSADSVRMDPSAMSARDTVQPSVWSTLRDCCTHLTARVKDSLKDEAKPDVVLEDEVAHRLAAKSNTPARTAPLPLASWPLLFLSQWCMHFSCRQHDSTFVSSTNTIWRYLWYYNKLSLCQLFAVTADTGPIGTAPGQVNEVIERFWRERQLRCRQGPGVEGERLHVLFHSYATSIDSVANTVTLYDYKNNVELRVPYHLLLLDLPLRAPGFVQQSGLHRTRYVEENVLPALAEGTRTAATAAAAAAEANAGASTGAMASTAASALAAAALRQNPLLGKTKAELEAIFADEASFMDVDPFTLQHRRYSDIFAVGDVAGLPSLKSYGAVFAQVPVVAHNVSQVLKAQQLQAKAEHGSKAAIALTDTSMRAVPRANARYTGYSSFHVVMTTWRAMWPEMRYPFDPYKHKEMQEVSSTLSSPTATSASSATSATAVLTSNTSEAWRKERWDVAQSLAYCDHHIWNNLAWRDLRGFLNGLYYQSALYELMYFFVFSRGQWHSPTWLAVPTYSSEDGAPCAPSLVNFL
jgi:NADH dehydrogenase FAD-containing subunit